MAPLGQLVLSSILTTLSLLGTSIAHPTVPATSEITLEARGSTLSCPANNGDTLTASGKPFTIQCNISYAGTNLGAPNFFSATSLNDCISRCATRSGCVGATWSPRTRACYLKSKISIRSNNSGTWSASLATTTLPTTSNTSSKASSAAPSASKHASSVAPSSTPISPSATPTQKPNFSSSAPPTSTRTPSSSPTYKPSSTPSAAPTVAGKRGLAYNDAVLTSYFAKTPSSQVSWAYNWDQTINGAYGNSKIEYVPMLWSNATSLTSSWNLNAKNAIAAGATSLLGFNEPDQCGNGGSCMGGYADVATQYKTWMNPLGNKALLGSPAVTNGGSPMGLTYLQNFISACTGCQIDFIPIHWYDSATNIAYFKNHIQSAYAAGGGRPIWITEFAGSGTVDQQITFLKTVMPWLDSLPYVHRYAYFMDTEGVLINSDGTGLSTIGQVYDTYTSSSYSR